MTRPIVPRRVARSAKKRAKNETTTDAERRAIKRLNSAPPASFYDLVTEGVLTEGQANTVRGRLRDRLVTVGYRPNDSGRGRPHRLVNVLPSK